MNGKGHQMSKTFNVSQYVFAHGAKPRGFGYWILFDANHPDSFDHTFEFRGTWSEAKKAAPAGAWILGS